jgi:creatinine amidohydrolase/Fe(II)-dependent formamide hydrolase-like protein
VRELELLTAPALRQLLASGTDTVVVPFGSVEDQNGHLPLGADSMLADLDGGNVAPLNVAVARFNERGGPARACAPRGDVGPDPGSHSGRWLTSVMLAFRAEVVELAAADSSLRAELSEADAERGAAYFERFVSSIVEQTRA